MLFSNNVKDERFNTCEQVLSSIVGENGLKELSFLFFEEQGCQGEMYPDAKYFSRWNEFTKFDDINIDQIKSMYLPPHATLKLYSSQGSFSSFRGPLLIPSFNSYLQVWSNFDQSPCLSDEKYDDCGKKIHFNKNDVDKFIIERNQTWNKFLQSYKNVEFPQISITNDLKIDLPIEDFFQVNCFQNNETPCKCVQAFNQSKIEYPQIYNELWIEHLYEDCNPKTQHMPKGAKISTLLDVKAECQQMIHSMIKNNSFPNRSNNQDLLYFKCGSENYQNAFSSGEVDPLKEYDDVLDNDYESRLTNESSIYIYIFLGLIIFIIFIIIIIGSQFYYGKNKKKVKNNLKIRQYNGTNF
jgi:hypothetical protein